MGGLKKWMPVTFATYAVGMLALSGFPLLFSGFWSKDEILHSAFNWAPSRVPFYLGLFGALLTAFYMTRQVYYVFFGEYRGTHSTADESHAEQHSNAPHESPRVMTVPLAILAVFAVLLGVLGTPAWPWFESCLEGHAAKLHLAHLFEGHVLGLMALSSLVVFAGIGLAWWLYSRQPTGAATDVLERWRPDIFALWRNKYFVDEAYERTFIRLNAWWANFCSALDYWLWNGLVKAVSLLVVGLAWIDRVFDEKVINLGFDAACRKLTQGGGLLSRLQSGKVQTYLRVIGVALTVLTLLLIWGCGR